MDAAPIGRGREWRSLQERLATQQSALIMLAGRPGSGRTHLLRRLGDSAREAGYTVAGCEEQLPIDPTTRVSDVRRALAAVLGGSDEQASVARSGLIATAIKPFTDLVRDERAVFATLDAAAPTFVGIDGYDPSPSVRRFIEGRLLPRNKKGAKPIVFVIVDRPERLTRIHEMADEFHELGDLDELEVRGHLTALSDEMRSPLTEQELDTYTAAATKDPSCLRALNRVFSLVSDGG